MEETSAGASDSPALLSVLGFWAAPRSPQAWKSFSRSTSRVTSLKAAGFFESVVLSRVDKSHIKPFPPMQQKVLSERSGERIEGQEKEEEEVRLTYTNAAVAGHHQAEDFSASVERLRGVCGQVWAFNVGVKVLLDRTDTALQELSKTFSIINLLLKSTGSCSFCFPNNFGRHCRCSMHLFHC